MSHGSTTHVKTTCGGHLRTRRELAGGSTPCRLYASRAHNTRPSTRAHLLLLLLRGGRCGVGAEGFSRNSGGEDAAGHGAVQVDGAAAAAGACFGVPGRLREHDPRQHRRRRVAGRAQVGRRLGRLFRQQRARVRRLAAGVNLQPIWTLVQVSEWHRQLVAQTGAQVANLAELTEEEVRRSADLQEKCGSHRAHL